MFDDRWDQDPWGPGWGDTVQGDAVGKGPAVVKWASCTVCVGSSERGRVTAECAERNGTGAGWPVGWRFSGWSVALIR